MSKRSFNRSERVNDLIQTALADVLPEEVDLSSYGMVTITEVEVNHDLSYAKVYISVLQDEKAPEVVKFLNEESRTLRQRLAKEVKLRIVPELKFIHDDSAIRGQRISSLINDALKK